MGAMNALMSEHTPSMHAWPRWHAVPHAPQLKNSLRKSTHCEPHDLFGPHAGTHAPWMQIEPAAQLVPHAPQLFGSPEMLAGRPLQSLMSPAAVKLPHVPFVQVVSCGHTLPGAPQFKLSLANETQVPPNMTKPVGQVAVQVAA